MECIVRADDLDRHGIDLVNTNRTQLREDNEIVRALIAFVEEAMKRALAAHAKWKEEKVDEDLDKSVAAKPAMRDTKALEARARVSARPLLRTPTVHHGARSTALAELEPLAGSITKSG